MSSQECCEDAHHTNKDSLFQYLLPQWLHSEGPRLNGNTKLSCYSFHLSFPPKNFLFSLFIPISLLISGHHVYLSVSARTLYNVHICSHLKWCFDSLPPRVPASGAWQVQADYVRLCQSPFACDVVTCLRRASSGLSQGLRFSTEESIHPGPIKRASAHTQRQGSISRAFIFTTVSEQWGILMICLPERLFQKWLLLSLMKIGRFKHIYSDVEKRIVFTMKSL